MTDYIKREDAYRRLTEYYHHTREIQHESLRIALIGIPSADVAPVRHGRNVYMDAKGHCEFKCSLCGADASIVEGGELDGGMFNYCPNCGAKMDEEVD